MTRTTSRRWLGRWLAPALATCVLAASVVAGKPGQAPSQSAQTPQLRRLSESEFRATIADLWFDEGEELVLPALPTWWCGERNAIALRSPVGTICHSDRGGQFRAKRTQRRRSTRGLEPAERHEDKDEQQQRGRRTEYVTERHRDKHNSAMRRAVEPRPGRPSC